MAATHRHVASVLVQDVVPTTHAEHPRSGSSPVRRAVQGASAQVHLPLISTGTAPMQSHTVRVLSVLTEKIFYMSYTNGTISSTKLFIATERGRG